MIIMILILNIIIIKMLLGCRANERNFILSWLGAGATSAPSWTEVIKLKKQNKELFEVIGELTIQLSQTKKKN